MRTKLVFHWERSSKGFHLYKEFSPEEESVTVGNLYIRKKAIGEEAPAEITVTLIWQK